MAGLKQEGVCEGRGNCLKYLKMGKLGGGGWNPGTTMIIFLISIVFRDVTVTIGGVVY